MSERQPSHTATPPCPACRIHTVHMRGVSHREGCVVSSCVVSSCRDKRSRTNQLVPANAVHGPPTGMGAGAAARRTAEGAHAQAHYAAAAHAQAAYATQYAAAFAALSGGAQQQQQQPQPVPPAAPGQIVPAGPTTLPVMGPPTRGMPYCTSYVILSFCHIYARHSRHTCTCHTLL